jgi:hypothetical protein
LRWISWLKKNKLKTKSFKIPIYFGVVTVVQTSNKEDIKKRFKIDCYDNNPCVYSRGSHYFTVIFPESNQIDINAISHECTHLANFRMNKIGYKFDYENDEPYAYLLGYLVEKVYSILVEFQKKNNFTI